jgi:hypothetical protein
LEPGRKEAVWMDLLCQGKDRYRTGRAAQVPEERSAVQLRASNTDCYSLCDY